MSKECIDYRLLISRAKEGDKQAKESLYRSEYKSIYFTALKMTGSRDDAVDIVQDSFLAAFENLGRLSVPEKFPAWINMITANKCRNFLKKRKPGFFSDMSCNEEEFEPQDEYARLPQEYSIQEDIKKYIRSVVDSLPDEQRFCVIMFYYNDMSLQDISYSLEVPVGTVKSRLNRAKKKMKDEIEKLERRGILLRGLTPAALFRISFENAENIPIPVSLSVMPSDGRKFKICPKCSNAIPEESVFCHVCGARQSSEPHQTSNGGEPTDPSSAGSSNFCEASDAAGITGKASGFKIAAAVISSACAAAMAIGTAAFVITSSKDKDNKESTAPPAATTASSSESTETSSAEDQKAVSETVTEAAVVSAPDTSSVEETVSEAEPEINNEGWEQAYFDKAYEITKKALNTDFGIFENYYYALYDIDGNGIPEMYIEDVTGGGIQSRGLYTYYDGELISLEVDTDPSLANSRLPFGYSRSGEKGIYLFDYQTGSRNSLYYLEDNKLVLKTDSADDDVDFFYISEMSTSDLGEFAERLGVETPDGYNWKSAYVKQVIDDMRILSHGPMEFQFMFINDDDIPELWVTDGYLGYLYTYADGEIITLSSRASDRTEVFSGYKERESIFMTGSSSFMNYYTIAVYEMKNLSEIKKGNFLKPKCTLSIEYYENRTIEIYKYNNEEITKDEYMEYSEKYKSSEIPYSCNDMGELYDTMKLF